MASQDARQDRNKFPTLVAVAGTTGTAALGTEDLVQLRGNDATGALYVQDLAGASGTTNVAGTVVVSNVEKGTISRIEGGTIVANGTVNVTTGSIVQTAGTITTGSLTNVATTGTILNLDKGTITRLEGGSVVITTGTTNVTTGSIVVTTGTTNVTTGSIVVTAGTISDLDTVGTVGRVEGGSIVVTAGTTNVNTGTITVGVGTITTGSLTNVATLGTILNLDKGTITRIEGGSVVVTVGTTNVTTGSIVQTAGTLTTGSLSNVATLGTVINLDKGTITRVEGGSVVITVGTVNVNTGSIVQTAGTVTTGSLSNVATLGTIQNLNTGTIAALTTGTLAGLASGTITAGTFRQQWQPVNQVTSFGTLGTANGSLFATISGASGAGTKHIVSGLSLVVSSGTCEVMVSYGSALTGGSVLARGYFGPGGGIAREFNPPIESAANSEIIYHFVNAGTAYLTVQYWKSTL